MPRPRKALMTLDRAAKKSENFLQRLIVRLRAYSAAPRMDSH